MKKSNKIIAVLLALVMMLTAVPMMTAGATETEPEAPAHVHAFEKTAEVKADCKTETNGSATYTCECGLAYTVATDEYAHELIGSVKQNDEATHKQRCDKCDAYVTEEHVFVDVEVTKPATCKEVGSKKVKCDVCGYETTKEIEKVEHTYTYVKTETGHKAMCTVCGDVIEVAHDFGEAGTGIVKTPNKCDADGVEVRACVCGETKEFPIPAAHKLPAKPTVSEDKATHVYTCEIETCGHVFTEEELAALEKTTAHNFKATVSGTATCKGAKGTLTLTCSECGYSEDYDVIAKHVFGDPIKYDDDKHVQECECGEKSYNDHVWGEGKVTKEATCKEAGEKTFTCVCGATKKEVIPVTETHTWDEGNVTTPAACETDGVKTFTCTVCEATKTEVIPMTGHNVTTWTVKTEATCGAKGVEEGTCTVCNTVQTREIPMVGEHTWGEWKVTREPNILWKGEETRECSVCGAKETREYVKPENPDEPEYKVGDVNGDNTVGAVDARMILRYVADLIELSEDELARADVDGNGQVQAVDARKILRMLVEQE